jgi:hypothetical protein
MEQTEVSEGIVKKQKTSHEGEEKVEGERCCTIYDPLRVEDPKWKTTVKENHGKMIRQVRFNSGENGNILVSIGDTQV